MAVNNKMVLPHKPFAFCYWPPTVTISKCLQALDMHLLN